MNVFPRRQSRVRVRYAETDQMGIVYYANYLVWFEVGRTDLLRLTGWTYREMEADGYALPVVEAHCEYRQSARYDDDLDIMTTGAHRLAGPCEVRLSSRARSRRRNACNRAHGACVADPRQAAATADRIAGPALSRMSVRDRNVPTHSVTSCRSGLAHSTVA